MAIDTDDLEALAAEFVLGTLDNDERRAAQVRLAADPAFAAAVAGWQARLQPLADANAPVALRRPRQQLARHAAAVAPAL